MASDILDSTKERMTRPLPAQDGARWSRAGAPTRNCSIASGRLYGTPTPIPQLGNVSTPEPRIF
jgi:ribosome recycling factor